MVRHQRECGVQAVLQPFRLHIQERQCRGGQGQPLLSCSFRDGSSSSPQSFGGLIAQVPSLSHGCNSHRTGAFLIVQVHFLLHRCNPYRTGASGCFIAQVPSLLPRCSVPPAVVSPVHACDFSQSQRRCSGAVIFIGISRLATQSAKV